MKPFSSIHIMNIILWLILSTVYSFPTNNRNETSDSFSFSPQFSSHSIQSDPSSKDEPSSSGIKELENKMNEKMKIMYEMISNRLDNIDNIVNEVQRNNEMSEWLERDNGEKYRLYDERKNWKEAQSRCKESGSDLVEIDNEELNTFLTKIVKMKPHINKVWLHMKNQPRVTPIDVQFSNISTKGIHTQCTVLSNDSSWSLMPCDKINPFICQKLPPTPRRNFDSEEEGEKESRFPTLNNGERSFDESNIKSSFSNRDRSTLNRMDTVTHEDRKGNKGVSGGLRGGLDFLFT